MSALLLAGVTAGGALAKYLAQKKAYKGNEFKNSGYGQTLLRQSKEGIYDEATRNKMVGKVSGQAGNWANYQSGRIKGNLINQGMEGSIAGQRLQADPYGNALKTTSEYRGNLELENEQSKKSALEKYHQLSYEDTVRRKEAEARNKAELWGGLTGAFTSGLSGYLGQKAVTSGKNLLNQATGYGNAVSQLANNFIKGSTTPEAFYAQLVGMGYSNEEALAILQQAINRPPGDTDNGSK